MEKKQFLLKVTIKHPVDDSNVNVHYSYNVTFSTANEGYGKKTYLKIGDDLTFDLRYNEDYHKGHEIEFLTAWACNHWNGENGAYILKDISIETL